MNHTFVLGLAVARYCEIFREIALGDTRRKKTFSLSLNQWKSILSESFHMLPGPSGAQA